MTIPNRLEPEECPACSAKGDEEVLHVVRGFAIARCRRCGLGRTRRPRDFDPLELYGEAYFTGGHDDGYADYPGSEPILRREFRAALAHLQRSGAPSGRLVEVGCAYGYFLDEAAAHFRVHGFEVAAEAAAAARGRGHDVVHGPVTETGLSARGPFDAFVLLDVIEHLADPLEVLSRLARHARPGAHLLLSTGDWGAITARVAGRHWRLMTPPQHLWFFTRATIALTLARAGFRVVDVRYPWKQVPLRLMAYQLGRALGVQHLVARLPLPELGLPVNLFDALRLVARREGALERGG